MEWPSTRRVVKNCPLKTRDEEIIELYVPCFVHERCRNPNCYQWEIQSKGNGKCTILNIQDNAYLATEKDRDGEWAINLSKTDKQLWDIHSTSDFTYS